MSDEIKNGDMSEELPENRTESKVDSDLEEGAAEQTVSAVSAEEQNVPANEEKPHIREPKRVTLRSAILASVALIVAAVMVTFTLCNSVYQKKLADAQMGGLVSGEPADTSRYSAFELFDLIFRSYSFEDLSDEEMMEAALKAYVAASGDDYAQYYTEEEYKALQSSSAGENEGVGVNVINGTAMVNGSEYKVIQVINVIKDSPAEKAGVKGGDLIYGVGIGEAMEPVHTLGYDMALTRLQGVAGTTAEFTVLRPNGDDGYEVLPFSILREPFTSSSIYYHVCETDAKVGIVKLLQFDLTTPGQFCEAVESLKAQGCEKFVFDVRYNPGGDLRSIEAVLSYFLEEGDILIRTKEKSGKEEISRVSERTYTGAYAACNVAKEDIGKYKDLQVVVLCNKSTASAAELFTATFLESEKLNATVVGVKTYGKGSMQSLLPLSYYGVEGMLKLTTAMYYPASGNGYNGVGLTPDVVVELDEALLDRNIYDISDAEDNQLQKALEYLK